MRVCPRCGSCFDDSFDLCSVDGDGLVESLSGTRLLCGRYRLEKKLAEGAMGQVFEAVHLALGNRVAVKVMQPQQKDVRVAVQRFHKEARILGAVKHPNAVLITDFDVEQRTGGTIPFLVTELLRGRPLDRLLDEKGRLSLVDVERIVVPLCDAVDEAHAQGIIHRDLKPSNVFLERLRDGGEVVKVLDFGIAKLLSRASDVDVADGEAAKRALDATLRDEILAALDDDGGGVATRPGRMTGPASPDPAPASSSAPSGDGSSPGTNTYAGLMVGTIPYMAPEQMTGERITRRADVHAIAVLVFEMLAGRLPFDGSDDEIIADKLADERPSLRERGVDVPEELDVLLQRCFARDPALRPDGVVDIARAVAHAARGAASRAATLDPATTLARQLADAARALAVAVDDEDDEETAADADGVVVDPVAAMSAARDALLSAGAALDKARAGLAELRSMARTRAPAPALVGAQLALDDALVGMRDVLARVAVHDPDGAAYLQLLWRRIDAVSQDVAASLDDGEVDEAAAHDDALAAVLDLPAAKASRSARGSFESLVRRLAGRDGLDANDALDDLLDEHLEVALAALQAGGEPGAQLLDGLWAHADALLLRDLGAEKGALRLVPYLAAHTASDGRFARVVDGLRDRRGAAAVDGVAALADARPGLRCLLLHPVTSARTAALAGLQLADLWTVAAHARTPVGVLALLFRHFCEHGSNDHLKVFFFCVKDAVLTASSSELPAALALVRAFFDVPCFHEDLVFEPLVELERGVRARGEAAGLLDDSYVRAVGRFVQEGARDDLPLEHLREIPLPILRKLARDGRMLTTFVSHPNERIARETIPHLLKLDDVLRYLKIVTIHRTVLVELAKRRRLFKGDVPKLALLTNPHTPPAAARPFIGLLGADQLRTLVNNRQMNPDVRKLVVQALARP